MSVKGRPLFLKIKIPPAAVWPRGYVPRFFWPILFFINLMWLPLWACYLMAVGIIQMTYVLSLALAALIEQHEARKAKKEHESVVSR